MAFPRGISQDAMRLKRDNGTADSWLAEHRNHNEAGTLDVWLASQDDLGVVAGVSKPNEAKPISKRRNPLESLRDAAFIFLGHIANPALAVINFSLDDLDSLIELRDDLRAVRLETENVISHIEPVINRLKREHELLAELENQRVENARLIHELAQAEERLRVTGHSEATPVQINRSSKKLTLKIAEPAT